MTSGGACRAIWRRGRFESAPSGSPFRVLDDRRCSTLGMGDLMDKLLRLLLT